MSAAGGGGGASSKELLINMVIDVGTEIDWLNFPYWDKVRASSVALDLPGLH
jgi:hypothetical protein